MEASTKENGEMTSNMDKERKSGAMAVVHMKESSQKAERMAKESLCGKMVHTMKVTLLMECSKVQVTITSKKVTRPTMVNSMKVELKVKER